MICNFSQKAKIFENFNGKCDFRKCKFYLIFRENLGKNLEKCVCGAFGGGQHEWWNLLKTAEKSTEIFNFYNCNWNFAIFKFNLTFYQFLSKMCSTI